jgi:hypothetical protein
VHAAEDDELRLRPGRCLLRQLEAVAGHVRELDDLVALVVVAEDEDPVAQGLLRPAGALHQRRVEASGRSPGQSTPRSDASSRERPSSSRASGVGVTPGISSAVSSCVVVMAAPRRGTVRLRRSDDNTDAVPSFPLVRRDAALVGGRRVTMEGSAARTR